VRRVVKLTGFVNAADDFRDHPNVINGWKIIRNKRVGLIHSGSNIDSDVFASVLASSHSQTLN
jgi:uncharacterized protein YciU (UPF0263 family)